MEDDERERVSESDFSSLPTKESAFFLLPIIERRRELEEKEEGEEPFTSSLRHKSPPSLVSSTSFAKEEEGNLATCGAKGVRVGTGA